MTEQESVQFRKTFQPTGEPVDEPAGTEPGTDRQEPTLIVSGKDYSRISAQGEEERRKTLLESVTVDGHGVAHNISPSGVETRLVAVRVNDAKQASVVPFEVVQNPEGGKVIQFALPADIPSRVGFFLGWGHSAEDMSGAIRAGFYPGTPLITEGTDEPIQEVLLGLRGIKGSEGQDREWSEQVGLFSALGFDPGRSRGFFDRASRPDRSTTSWEMQPLLIIPRALDDQFEHLDRQRVEGSALQVLYYSTASVQAAPSPASTFRGYEEPSRMLSFATRDLGLAFGRSHLQTGTTTGIDVKGLEGAFRLAAVPQGK